MKLLFLFCVCMTLSAALPQRRSYKNYAQRKQLRQADVAGNVTTTVAPVTTTTTVSTTESSGEETQTEVGVQELVAEVNQSAAVVSTVEPDAEPRPIAEPTKAPVVPAEVVPVVEQQQQPSANQTKPEEETDDSSSEEDAEEEAEAKLIQVSELAVPHPTTIKKTRGTRPRLNPEFGGIVRGYISEATGELLVPIDALPPNFRYSVIHDKAELNAEDVIPASSEEANPDHHEEIESQSEEVIPTKVSESGVVYEPKGPSANETEVSSVSEEVKPESSSGEEAEEKVVSSESPEKPSAETAPKEPPITVFNPPPLAALPATKPTDEDDEEEAGGRRLFPPGLGYYYNPYNFNPYYDDDYDF